MIETMWNLANKLTLLRILMTPLVVLLLYFEGPVTCVLTALAAVLHFCFCHGLGGRVCCPALQYGHQHGQVS